MRFAIKTIYLTGWRFMRIAFITRSTLYDVPGGDTVQVVQMAGHLRRSGVETSIFLTTEKIDYAAYDMLHFSNITRPSDILYHITKTTKPFVLSPRLIDYSEYDRQYRQGFSGFILRKFPGQNEYIKTLSRWLTGKDSLRSRNYIWKGQQKSIREILNRAGGILPNSRSEYLRMQELYEIDKSYTIVPNGIDSSLFCPDDEIEKDNKLVICAARIEGLKNQLNLIRALNDTEYTLILLGSAAPNQKKYYDECKRIASRNILFHGQVGQDKLIDYYKAAKVHALPSWFETCGLSSLEAAAMGCNIVITEKGYTREYFGNDGFYCDPADPASIFTAIEAAARSDSPTGLQKKILQEYTWQQAADITLKAYHQIIST
jgi:glycosyltransferase involved in cell wall biosynthesis